jgi:hypothetical protein
MREKTLSIQDIGFIAVTRVLLGVGIGLFAASALNREQRKILGSALLSVGAVTTVPILIHVLGKRCNAVPPVILAA